MPLIRNGRIVEDTWETVTTAIPEGRRVIATLEQWRDHKDDFRGRDKIPGIRLKSDESPDLIADDLDRFGLVALEFPAFTDGRSFSHARLLRERHGFKGEIRAVGSVIPDQYQFLDRCGFDTVEIPEGADIAVWERCLNNIRHWYQPTADGRRTIVRRRGDALGRDMD